MAVARGYINVTAIHSWSQLLSKYKGTALSLQQIKNLKSRKSIKIAILHFKIIEE